MRLTSIAIWCHLEPWGIRPKKQNLLFSQQLNWIGFYGINKILKSPGKQSNLHTENTGTFKDYALKQVWFSETELSSSGQNSSNFGLKYLKTLSFTPFSHFICSFYGESLVLQLFFCFSGQMHSWSGIKHRCNILNFDEALTRTIFSTYGLF